MPDYPRVSLLHPQSFDTGRPYNEPTFTYQTAPQHATQQCPPVSNYSSQMTPLNYGSHTRGPYDGQTGAYLDYQGPPPSTFRVVNFSPNRGRPGTPFSATITSSWEIMSTQNMSFSFNRSRRVAATATKTIMEHDRMFEYVVAATVPDIEEWVSEVPVMLCVESPSGEEVETEVGNFHYDIGHDPYRMPDDLRPSLRDVNADFKPEHDYQGYHNQSSSYRVPYTMPAPYDNMSATSLRMPSFSQQSIAPSHQNASSNILPWTSHQRGSISARQEYIPEASAQPRLVRTSTLEAFRAPMAHSASGGYYQQQMKPPQARLKFAESLEAFGRPDRWSEEHLRAGRRVMYFFRKQQGAEVVLRFRVANADEVGGGGSTRPQHSVAVSCILWQQQRQCFVTSVDTIMLLEHIIGYKFPTEEKNRIRRNLEHFKPITVKKPVPGGPSSQIRSGEKEMDTTELFSTIMSFGAPKPRNIEKDIKVFQWRDLAKALQKIVSKYSATVKPAHPPPQATLPTPASSTGGSSGGSYGDASALFLHSSDRNLSGLYSPRGSHARNISGPALQPTYAPSSFANSMPSGHRLNSPPYNLNPIRGQATDLHQQGIHTQLPNPLYESWPTTPTHHMPAPHAPSQYSTPRPSWDLGMQLGVGNSMAVYNDGGQGGNPTGVDTQHSLHHSEGERAVSSGEILASLKDGGQGSGGHLRHQVRTA